MKSVREEFENWWLAENDEAAIRDGESYKGVAFSHWVTWRQSRNAAVEAAAQTVELAWGLWSNLAPDDSRRLANFLAQQVRSMGVDCMECGAFRDQNGTLGCECAKQHGEEE